MKDDIPEVFKNIESQRKDYYEYPAMKYIEFLNSGESKLLLDGMTAIVTGGGKGIGKGISIRLAAAGAKIVIVGNSNMKMAEETCEAIRVHGGEAECIGIDLSEPSAAAKVVDFAVEKFGGVDILINNAAFQPNLDIDEYTGEIFGKVIDVNLLGYMRMISACLPYLKKSGKGRIINISSVHGKKPTGFDIAYATSKGGIYMLTRETAVEYAKYGITCNSILPGGTAIEFKSADPATGVKPSRIKILRVNRDKSFPHPFRTGLPADNGNLCVFLCSKLGEHYNGTATRADGGMMLY